jgi:hypothetical protein
MTPSPQSSFTIAKFAESMVMTAIVALGGIEQAVGALNAYCEDQMRGTHSKPSHPPFGPYRHKPMYQITIGADAAGDMIRFEFENSGSVQLSETIPFEVNGAKGSVLTPVLLTGKASANAPSSVDGHHQHHHHDTDPPAGMLDDATLRSQGFKPAPYDPHPSWPLVQCPSSSPHHNGSYVCHPPTTGACNSSYRLVQRLSHHGKCFPDGDPYVESGIMMGGFGCYPGLDIVWVTNRCSGRFTCENGRTILCGTSKINTHQNCTCL